MIEGELYTSAHLPNSLRTILMTFLCLSPAWGILDTETVLHFIFLIHSLYHLLSFTRFNTPITSISIYLSYNPIIKYARISFLIFDISFVLLDLDHLLFTSVNPYPFLTSLSSCIFPFLKFMHIISFHSSVAKDTPPQAFSDCFKSICTKDYSFKFILILVQLLRLCFTSIICDTRYNYSFSIILFPLCRTTLARFAYNFSSYF